MVAEFHEGSGGSPHGKGDTGRGPRAPRAISTPLCHEFSVHAHFKLICTMFVFVECLLHKSCVVIFVPFAMEFLCRNCLCSRTTLIIHRIENRSSSETYKNNLSYNIR